MTEYCGPKPAVSRADGEILEAVENPFLDFYLDGCEGDSATRWSDASARIAKSLLQAFKL